MNLENYIAIGGLSGLYTMVASKPNGLVVKDFNGGKAKFCSLRKYQFTPLETVGIYTMTDTEDLKTIFTAMKAQKEIPNPKASKEELLTFFAAVLPNYDKDKVFPNHVSKIIKWYNELDEHGFLTEKKEKTTAKKQEKKTTKKAAPKKPTKKATPSKAKVSKATSKRPASAKNTRTTKK